MIPKYYEHFSAEMLVARRRRNNGSAENCLWERRVQERELPNICRSLLLDRFRRQSSAPTFLLTSIAAQR